ncbi:MAG: hypothetical protein KAI53_02725 [Candidatus Aenigmarchaeota archaeon]|nr:hypothetical protein [Candidatus Aenigmarchaeota archaeon]
MDFKDILKGLVKKGDFIYTNGTMGKNFLEVAALPTNPAWIDALLDLIVPVFKKIKPDYIVCVEGISVATATHISREFGIPLLMIPKGEHPYTQTIRGEFKKNKSVVVFTTLINNPSGIMHTCEILKKNGLKTKYVVSLINRGKNLNELFLKEEIKFLSIYDYPSDDSAEIKENENYIRLFK